MRDSNGAPPAGGPRIDKRNQPPLALLLAIVVSGTLSVHVFVPALPVAARSLGVSDGAIQLSITLCIAALAVGQLVYGPLSDRFGRRPILLGGLVLYAVAGAVAALAPDLSTLLAARMAQGFGGCAGLVLGRAILRDLAGPREAAARLALLNMFQSFSPAMAPAVGGFIALAANWRAIFVLLAAIGGATVAVAYRRLPETHVPSHHSGLPALLRSYPRLLGSHAFRCYAVAGPVAVMGFYAFLSAAPFIFEQRLHRRPEESGLYFAVPILGYVVGSLLANRLVGRMDPWRLMFCGLLAAAAAAFAFLAADLAGWLGLPAIMATMLLFTAATGLASPLALTAAVSVRPDAIGAASGLYGSWQMVYGALCTLAVGLFPDDPARTVGIVMTVSTVWALLAAWAVRARPMR